MVFPTVPEGSAGFWAGPETTERRSSVSPPMVSSSPAPGEKNGNGTGTVYVDEAGA